MTPLSARASDAHPHPRFDYEPHIDAYVKTYRRKHSTFRERLGEAWRGSWLSFRASDAHKHPRVAPGELIP